MYGAKKKSPAKKYGAKTPMAKKKTPMKKPLVGKQKNLPDAIKKAIKAAPTTKKKSPAKMVKSMGSAGMVGKAGTAKPPGGPKRKKSTTARNR